MQSINIRYKNLLKYFIKIQFSTPISISIFLGKNFFKQFENIQCTCKENTEHTLLNIVHS